MLTRQRLTIRSIATLAIPGLLVMTMAVACGGGSEPTPPATADSGLAATPTLAPTDTVQPTATAVAEEESQQEDATSFTSPVTTPPQEGGASETVGAADSPLPAPTETSTTTAPTELPPTPTPVPEPSVFNPDDISLGLELVADGLAQPVYAAHAGDGSGRIFVIEKAGTIAVIGDDGLQPEPFLDIRDRVGSSGSEQGLLGLAFHPSFPDDKRFYVYYTDRSGGTVISSFTTNAEGTLADPGSEAILIRQEQPAGNHNGGMIAFGPDGMLYAGLGDGGGANDRFGHGQNLTSILGTIIRIDVSQQGSYAIPADNPLLDNPDARPEIWAYGLRNPWRFSFDRATSDLYIADVGQNQWEEVNVESAGSTGGVNYGWPIMEGNHCFQRDDCDLAGLALPVAEYSHSQGCSVTGGYVYRGQAQPSLQGAYFYGDYCIGRIWALYQDDAGQWQSVNVLDSGRQLSSFGETENGEVLAVDIQGAVLRLVDQGAQ